MNKEPRHTLGSMILTLGDVVFILVVLLLIGLGVWAGLTGKDSVNTTNDLHIYPQADGSVLVLP